MKNGSLNETEVTIEIICENCGNLFRVVPSRLKHGRGKHCSTKCQYDAIKKRPKKVVERICIGCGNKFLVRECRVGKHKGVGKYCTRSCRDEHRTGKNVPNFIDGNSENWHGPNWYAQRRKAKQRDQNTCVDCGMTESDALIAYGQSLHVHHKIPFRKFYGDYKNANALSNLETLCAPCHRTKEGKIQREDRLS